MEKRLMLALAMLLVASLALAQQNPSGQGPTVLNGGILSSPSAGFAGAGPNNQGGPGLGRHDLWSTATSKPLGCETCHLPHTAPTYGNSFLWAWKNMPTSLPTYQTITNTGGGLATPPTASVATGPSGNTRSMLCFSCHDGTSASNNNIVGGNTINGFPYSLVNTNGAGYSAGLQTEHPVDAVFPKTNDYVQPAILGALGMYGATATVGIDTLPLWDGLYHVECTTCHDVHNDYLADNGTHGGVPFLRVANTNGTYLCRECHNAQ